MTAGLPTPGLDERSGHLGVASPGWMERTETMKTIQYLARINRDPHSDWGASVPDLR